MNSLYLDRVSTYSLSRLREEPGKLERDLEGLKKETEVASVDNYSAHIDNHRCLAAGLNGLTSMSKSLEGFSGLVSGVTDEAKVFLDVAPKFLEDHKQFRSTLEQYGQVLELLEIPQLMDACVKRQAYEDAIRLASFVQKLAHRHKVLYAAKEGDSGGPDGRKKGKGIELVSSIDKDVEKIVRVLYRQLVQAMSGSMTLPVCVRTVGHLRRVLRLKDTYMQRSMGDAGPTRSTADNGALSRLFLKCRSKFVRSELAKLKQDGPADYVVQCIDKERVLLSDVMVQYNAIFFHEEDEEDEEKAWNEVIEPMREWVLKHVKKTMDLLKKYLPLIEDGASLANAMDQAMYMGQSMAKFGADFRLLMVPLCEGSVYTLVDNGWRHALDSFRKNIRYVEWLEIDVKGIMKEARKSGFKKEKVVQDLDATPPGVPNILINFPTIGLFVNTVINALNELRHIALLSLRHKLGDHLIATMKEMVEIVRGAAPGDDLAAEHRKKANTRYAAFVNHGVLPAIRHLTTLFLIVYGNTDPDHIAYMREESEKLLQLALECCGNGDGKLSPDRPKRAPQLEESDDHDENDAIL